MMKRSTTRWQLGLLSVLALVGLAACGNGGGGNGGPGNGNGAGNGSQRGAGNGPLSVNDDGTTRLDGSVLRSRLDSIPPGQLTSADAAALAYLREEELLAHDVYVALGRQWNLRAFANIAAAEQTHTGAVATLLERHALADPANGHVAGTFVNADL